MTLIIVSDPSFASASLDSRVEEPQVLAELFSNEKPEPEYLHMRVDVSRCRSWEFESPESRRFLKRMAHRRLRRAGRRLLDNAPTKALHGW